MQLEDIAAVLSIDGQIEALLEYCSTKNCGQTIESADQCHGCHIMDRLNELAPKNTVPENHTEECPICFGDGLLGSGIDCFTEVHQCAHCGGVGSLDIDSKHYRIDEDEDVELKYNYIT